MSNKKTELSYNGWANRETWLVNVWEYVDYFVEVYFDSGQKPDDVNERGIQDMFDEAIDGDIPSNGIVSDMLGGALELIDWREIEVAVRENLEQRILDDF